MALATVMALVMLLVASGVSLPLRDPDDTLVGPSWVRLPLLVLAAVLVDVLPRAWRRRSRGTGERGALHSTFAERWPRSQIRFTLAGLTSWYVTYVAFRNLKNAVPFLNGSVWDIKLAALDRFLWFGHTPAVLLHDAFGTGWAASVFSVAYLGWIVLIPVSLLWALAWTRKHAIAAWYVTALAADWVLGAAAYYAVPSLGPIYSAPRDFDSLRSTSVTWLQDSLIADRHEVLTNPHGTDTLQSIAAFPSLHVAIMVTLCVLVQSSARLRATKVAAWAMLVVTCFATVYLGWHFFVDVVGGAAVGGLGAWVGALAIDKTNRGQRYLPATVPATTPDPVG
jgi:membrane-associated phospholipid phosphatase